MSFGGVAPRLLREAFRAEFAAGLASLLRKGVAPIAELFSREARRFLRAIGNIRLRRGMLSPPPLMSAPSRKARGEDALSRLPDGVLAGICERLDFSDVGRLQTCCKAFVDLSPLFAPASDARVVLDFLREHPDPRAWGLRTLNVAGELGSVDLLRLLRRRKHFDALSRAAACVRCVLAPRKNSAALVLEYLRDDGREYGPHPDEQPLSSFRFACAQIMGQIAKVGRVDLLDELRDEAFAQNAVVKSLTCAAAAECGSLGSLEWLERRGWLSGRERDVHRRVAHYGDVACLKFLKSAGFRLYPGIMEDAACSGKLEAIEWLREEGCVETPIVRVFARLMDHREILAWLDARAIV